MAVGAGTEVLTGQDISRALQRIAHEILEKNHGAAGLMLLGIPTRGVPLAARLADVIGGIEAGWEAGRSLGELDVTMYRDDLNRGPIRPLGATRIPPGGIDGATVVLVDDVLYSGRTIRAALDAIADIGRPKAVRLAVLVDRGHRELPIRADYVGKNLPTAADERVTVKLQETDGTDVVLIQRTEGER
ncbi:MAG: bifunctional pyr operon transcriptional regulator/uracil phosphoribosyltransferase PyrR [Bifidobacteriaceae bacterium]|jgi:pyrimidine operon attenuation protein/uracil phosphoribosyltransferase|nr:bifunctional pyr operon transcriptional regulator/uracil phosphoribosyltransferase PyrR [Bifidobacteriaceae bacterium]